MRLQKIENQSQWKKQSTQGEVDNIENHNTENNIKELEEKENRNMALNSWEGKLDIKPIKVGNK